jgi:Lon protease-like protein
MSLNCPYTDIRELPEILPVFPLAGAVLLPRGELPLNVFEPRYVAMIDAAISDERLIGMIQPLQSGNGATPPRLFQIGCAGRITRFAETGDGRYLITLTGVARFRIGEEVTEHTPYRRFKVNYEGFQPDLLPGAGENAVDRESMVAMLRSFAESSKLEIDWASIDAAPTETLVNALAMMSPFGANEKQALVEAIDLKTRAETLVALAKLDLAQREGEGQQWH